MTDRHRPITANIKTLLNGIKVDANDGGTDWSHSLRFRPDHDSFHCEILNVMHHGHAFENSSLHYWESTLFIKALDNHMHKKSVNCKLSSHF